MFHRLGIFAPACVLALAIGANDAAGQHPSSQPHDNPSPHREPVGGHDQHHLEGMQHDFSDAELWFRIFEGSDRDEWQQPHIVIDLLDLSPGMRVADIGAGTGYFLSHLSRAVGQSGEILALDIEPNLVEFMSARFEREGLTNARAVLVAPDDPGLSTGSIDRILIVNTWHHIGGRIEYSRKLLRSLSEGGAVYIVDFTMEAEEGPPVENRLPPEAVLSELSEAGLDAELLDSSLSQQYVVVGRRPLE